MLQLYPFGAPARNDVARVHQDQRTQPPATGASRAPKNRTKGTPTPIQPKHSCMAHARIAHRRRLANRQEPRSAPVSHLCRPLRRAALSKLLVRTHVGVGASVLHGARVCALCPPTEPDRPPLAPRQPCCGLYSIGTPLDVPTACRRACALLAMIASSAGLRRAETSQRHTDASESMARCSCCQRVAV